MRILKLSPSKIETYRKYKDEEYFGKITAESVIKSLSGKTEWTPKAEFGSAFHAVQEHGAKKFFNKESGLYHIQDRDMPSEVVCEYSEIELADTFHMEHPAMVWEIKDVYEVKVDNFLVRIRLRIDSMEGNVVYESKTSANSLDVFVHERSMQWRIYLMATEAARVTYNMYNYLQPKRGPRIVRHTAFSFYPYPDMVDDVKRSISGLIEFCELNNLMDLIEVKEAPPLTIDEEVGF